MKKLNILKCFLIFSFVFIVCFLQAQNVGVGTTSPAAKLHVNGSFKLVNGTEGLGKVLTSDKGGTASWQTLNTSETTTTGFGAWGDCSTSNISGYNPVFADDGTSNSFLGVSTSISGSYALVGSPGKVVNGSSNQGVAYIYFFDGTNWSQQQMLTAIDGVANDFFGSSVRINGDYAIVGAYGKTVNGKTNHGKAYIFFNNGSSWVQVGSGITASDGAADDLFGSSVGIDGNYAIVGANNKTVGSNWGQGKVYFFNNNSGNWVQVGTGLTAIDGTTGDYFGTSVSIHGNNAIIGSKKMINGNFAQGKAYIFKNTAGNWAQVGTGITSFDAHEYELFGNAVSIYGNYAILGAKHKNFEANIRQGAAYIYFFNGTSWVFQQKLTANDGAAEDNFGAGLIISNNYAMVGAFNKKNGLNY